MLDIDFKFDEKGQEYLETSMTGKALLSISQLNKGTAFSENERHVFGLIGKLPNRVENIEDQVARCYVQYKGFNEQINRNVYLNNLLNTNQVLFYKLVQEHIKEMLPTIYTPIVGNAVKVFNKKFMHPRGLYISYEDRDRIEEILDNRSNPHIDLIVVSDGEGVLGIGDQGIGGMAIPVAKLMVYTAFGNINPLNTLPILLDAGTNNTELLEDPLYLGWRHKRVVGAEYTEFVAKFIAALKNKFPHVFLHWEDFGRTNAYRNLLAYRNELCSFNDDIQGTGVVALAAILAAVKRTDTPLTEQRIVIFGGGTAGIGVADNVLKALIRNGASEEQARHCFYIVDRYGLVTESCDDISDAQKPYARHAHDFSHWQIENPHQISLQEVMTNVKPTILIGCSAQAGAFTQSIIKTMAQHCQHPIIFPLSNPTEKAEATPTDILFWTKGKALIATGSPFEDVNYEGEVFPISQCNNYLAFPGIGLGVIACRAKTLSDAMLWEASKTLGTFTNNPKLLLPSIEKAREASIAIATTIVKTAFEEGVAQVKKPQCYTALVEAQLWQPHYLPYKLKKQGG